MIHKFALPIVVVGVLAGLLRGDQPVPPPHKEFVVHEWAVWVKGQSPKGTVLSSPAELTAGRPKFVQIIKEPRQIQQMPWKKPVLYLYGDEGLIVRIKVTADQGLLSAYWPAGKVLTHVTRDKGWRDGGQIVTDTIGIEWSGSLHAKPEGTLGEAPKDHWWSALREVPSMYFVADKECERFLFYEATAQQEPTVTAKISADQLKLANTDGSAASQAMVIVNSGDKRYCRVLDSIKASGEATISKAEFLAKAFSEEQLLEACQAHWRQFGMTEAEAKAIVKSWEPDLLRPWQILVISRMPADLYDKMFPLTVTRKPDKLVRVGMVFDRLSGKACANIVPGLSDHIKALREEAHAEDQTQSKQAKAALDELGVEE
jgi:hypothetical protein